MDHEAKWQGLLMVGLYDIEKYVIKKPVFYQFTNYSYSVGYENFSYQEPWRISPFV